MKQNLTVLPTSGTAAAQHGATMDDTSTMAVFDRFQAHLRRKGNVNLARLEEDIRGRIRLAVAGALGDGAAGKEEESRRLADLLLLRYCFVRLAATTQDLPPLIDNEEDGIAMFMEPHRVQMGRFASLFPNDLRPLVKNPESMTDRVELRLLRLVGERRVPKTRFYVPDPLFEEGSELRVRRDYVPAPAMSRAALWGKNNVDELLGASSRSRYWADQLVRSGKIGTGKILRFMR